MTTKPDKNEIFRRRLLAARKRTLRYLVLAMEGQARQMAVQAWQGVRRGRGRRQAVPFNPVTQLKREIMPLITQLAELAAGGALPLERPAKKSGRYPSRPNARRRRRDGAAAAKAAPLPSMEKTSAEASV